MKKKNNTQGRRARKPWRTLSLSRTLIFSLLTIMALLAFSCENAWVIAILPPEYDIKLSINGIDAGDGTHELSPEAVNYTTVVKDTITISNKGSKATGPLSVELSGAESGSFTLSRGSIGSIARGRTDAFTIVPVIGLGAGNHSTTITVSGGNGIRAGFTLIFKVGNGSELYPFSVKDEETLRMVGEAGTGIAGDETWNLSAYYTQTKDIDLTGKADWEPVGTATNPFQGSYDGNGHFIKGISTNNPSETHQGFFSFINPTGIVQNLRLIEVDVKGTGSIGGIAGENHGKIENCEVSGIVTTTTSSNGGLTGVNRGAINRCYVSVNVTGDSYSGGVTGFNYNTIERCYASGNVAAGGMYAGGITGFNYGTVEHCYASGNVSGTIYVGGVSGFNNENIKHCYALGEVVGVDIVGGLVGYLSGLGVLENCVGLNPSLEVPNINYGRVAGTNVGDITNCFGLAGMTIPLGPYNGEDGNNFSNTGQAAWSAAAPAGPGFDFTTVWEWSSAKNRPILRGVGGQ